MTPTEPAGVDERDTVAQVGGRWAAIFSSDGQRDGIFTQLFSARKAAA